MKEIPLTKGAITLVDEEDYDYLIQWKWRLHSNGYAVRSIFLGRVNEKPKIGLVYMHRALINPPGAFQVDHINGDKLDNRRFNLRSVTPSQNCMNRRKRIDNTSGVIGVRWNKRLKGWESYIKLNGKNIYLGVSYQKENAIHIRKEAEKSYFKDFRFKGSY